jgi:hypothetical protein
MLHLELQLVILLLDDLLPCLLKLLWPSLLCCKWELLFLALLIAFPYRLGVLIPPLLLLSFDFSKVLLEKVFRDGV